MFLKTLNLEDEEENLRSYRTEAEDNDFATGLSFEDLEKVHMKTKLLPTFTLQIWHQIVI